MSNQKNSNTEADRDLAKYVARKRELRPSSELRCSVRCAASSTGTDEISFWFDRLGLIATACPCKMDKDVVEAAHRLGTETCQRTLTTIMSALCMRGAIKNSGAPSWNAPKTGPSTGELEATIRKLVDPVTATALLENANIDSLRLARSTVKKEFAGLIENQDHKTWHVYALNKYTAPIIMNKWDIFRNHVRFTSTTTGIKLELFSGSFAPIGKPDYYHWNVNPDALMDRYGDTGRSSRWSGKTYSECVVCPKRPQLSAQHCRTRGHQEAMGTLMQQVLHVVNHPLKYIRAGQQGSFTT